MTHPDEAARVKPPAAWRLWENPIFRRYSRSRLRGARFMGTLLITVLLSAFAYLIVPIGAERVDEGRQRTRAFIEKQIRKHPEQAVNYKYWLENEHKPVREEPYMYQRMTLIPLLIIQGLILFLFGTGQTAGGMTAERDEGMVDYQRLTPMTPLAKVLGYLLGLPVREWVMFLCTLPFTVLGLWRGAVPASAWVPVAIVFLTSVILYHLTGLTAGTVFKNRRWAFLFSMGIIFLLYTLVPQGSRFGMPFLRYVTVWPVAMESVDIFPDVQVRTWRMLSGHVGGAGVDFFRWNLSELVFTLIVQGSFILTLLVMVWRKWRQSDSHLLSKGWALLVFAWLCILPIGNALPGIEDRTLFPSYGFRVMMRGPSNQASLLPAPEEALALCAFYGLLMLLFLLYLTVMLTPTQDSQARGLRRAAKLGRKHAPFFSDESSAFLIVFVLTAGGAAAWAWFTHSVLGSRWFYAGPGMSAFALFFAVLAPATFGFHALLESKGGKWPFLAVVFLGVVPVLASLIVLAASRHTPTSAVMIAGASPLTLTGYAVEHFIPWGRMPESAASLHATAGSALRLWPFLYAAAAVAAMMNLRRHWQRRKSGK